MGLLLIVRSSLSCGAWDLNPVAIRVARYGNDPRTFMRRGYRALGHSQGLRYPNPPLAAEREAPVFIDLLHDLDVPATLPGREAPRESDMRTQRSSHGHRHHVATST